MLGVDIRASHPSPNTSVLGKAFDFTFGALCVVMIGTVTVVVNGHKCSDSPKAQHRGSAVASCDPGSVQVVLQVGDDALGWVGHSGIRAGQDEAAESVHVLYNCHTQHFHQLFMQKNSFPFTEYSSR